MSKALILFGILCTNSCGGKTDPHSILEDYFAAIATSDLDRAFPHLSEDTLAALARAETEFLAEQGASSGRDSKDGTEALARRYFARCYGVEERAVPISVPRKWSERILKVEVEGNGARATTERLDGSAGKILMQRERGEWRVVLSVE